MKNTAAGIQPRTFPWFLIPGLILFVLSVLGFAILDSSNQEFTRLQQEQEASHLASSLAPIFGPGMDAPGYRSKNSNHAGMNGVLSPQNHEDAWTQEQLDAFASKSSLILSDAQSIGLQGMALVSSTGRLIWTNTADQDALVKRLATGREFRLLPYGDRVYHSPDLGSMTYLKPLMRGPGKRMAPGSDEPLGMVLALDYQGGGLYLEGLGRRIILWAIAILVWSALAAMIGLLRHNQKLQEDLGHREVLAQTGAAARTLAHEVRTPLSIILMQKTLLQRQLGPEHLPALERIGTEAKRIQGLTQDLRKLMASPGSPAALPENKQETLPQQTSLVDFLADFTASGVWQDLQIVSGPPITAGIPEDHLSSILNNLIQNAKDADPASPVWISWIYRAGRRSTPGKVKIYVEDCAGGIEHRLRRRIFDPFFTTKTSGMGLGLKHSRDLARRAGGDLVYHALDKPSHPGATGKGSRFEIQLRAYPASEVPTQRTAP